MVIECEVEKVPVAEARKTGRWERKTYFIRNGKRRVGPYRNLLDAKLAVRRAEEAVRRKRVLAAAARVEAN